MMDFGDVQDCFGKKFYPINTKIAWPTPSSRNPASTKDIALITRDVDFRHFAKHGGLKLAV